MFETRLRAARARTAYRLDRTSGEWRPVPVDASRKAASAGLVPQLSNACDFKGRVDRKTFVRIAFLAITLIAFARLMDWIVFGATPGAVPAFFVSFAGAALVLPLLAASVRRLRDAQFSARWMLLVLLPLLGWIWLALLLSRRGSTTRLTPDARL